MRETELYLLRIRISELLKDTFTPESIESLKKNIRLFLFSVKKTEENGDLIEFLNGFASIYIRLANGLSPSQPRRSKRRHQFSIHVSLGTDRNI